MAQQPKDPLEAAKVKKATPPTPAVVPSVDNGSPDPNEWNGGPTKDIPHKVPPAPIVPPAPEPPAAVRPPPHPSLAPCASGKWVVAKAKVISWFGGMTTLAKGSVIGIDSYGPADFERLLSQGVQLEPVE